MLIFIGGIHGVGKTFFCEQLINKVPNNVSQNIVFTSASHIINTEKNDYKDQSKLVSDVDLNQKLLIQGVKKLKEKGGVIILDGHFCLLTTEKEIVQLNPDVFESLAIDELILLVPSDVSVIRERYSTRGDNYLSNWDGLDNFVLSESEQAQKIADSLSIPLSKFKNDDFRGFYQYFLNKLL